MIQKSISRIPPRLSYNGLTVVLSKPSRFDKNQNGIVYDLMRAGGGQIFDKCLQPEFNRFQCDIRLKEVMEPLLPDTKCILLLGENAARLWLNNKENTIGEIRGSVYSYNGIPAIPSFFPQDARDVMNYESQFNAPEGLDATEIMIDESITSDKRRHGVTARKNYRFWLDKDVQKAKRIIFNGGKVPPRPFEPDYRISPSADEIISVLMAAKGELLFLDLETFHPAFDCKCIGFSIGIGNPIYVFPFFDFKGEWAYTDIPKIWNAFAIACTRNTCVAHYGKGFDFFVLAYHYRIPLSKNLFDTLIAQHRCFSEVEKSLGHFTSLWTYEQFHKDEGNIGYNSPTGMYKTMQYCGKDVYTMILGYIELMKYAKSIPGLLDSIKEANDAIRPYLITELHGLEYDEVARKEIVTENDKLMDLYRKLIEHLIGPNNIQEIAGKSKSCMAGSNKQCVKYFHEMLSYPVMDWGNETKKGERNPSLGKDNMFKLRIRFNNPVISLILAYRQTQKETGSLGFTPWKI